MVDASDGSVRIFTRERMMRLATSTAAVPEASVTSFVMHALPPMGGGAAATPSSLVKKEREKGDDTN